MSTPVPTTTGPGSTSFAVWITSLIAGIASAIEGVVTPGSTAHTAVYGGGGIIIALGGTITKLLHDKGLHIATIQAAGADIADQLPQLKTDLATAIDFVEQDVPALKGAVNNVQSRMSAVEGKAEAAVASIPGEPQLEAAARSALTKLLGGNTLVNTTPAATPEPAPLTVDPGTPPVVVASVAPVAPPVS